MKKILFLLLIYVVKLSAYDYLFAYNANAVGNSSKELHFINENNNYWFRIMGDNGEQYGTIYTIEWFNYIQKNLTSIYISNENFQNIYKNDVIFLNDLYTSNNYNRQCFLNFLYNENNFTSSNYIHYDNYELLYNSDGLVIESILNGKWAGLYDGPDDSGYLYDDKGDLKYVNGVSPSFFDILFNKLMRRFGINLQSIFIKKIFYPLLILIFACVVLRTVIRLAFKAFLIRFYDKKIGQLEKRREKIENA